MAGCGFAAILPKVYAIKMFDVVWRWYPEIRVRVFVDDADLNTEGPDERIIFHEIALATVRLLTELVRFLGVRVGVSKCVRVGHLRHMSTAT